jgi:hypothetical protein
MPLACLYGTQRIMRSSTTMPMALLLLLLPLALRPPCSLHLIVRPALLAPAERAPLPVAVLPEGPTTLCPAAEKGCPKTVLPALLCSRNTTAPPLTAVPDARR